MKITTLADLKKALVDIPDDVLENFGAGIGEDGEGVELLAWLDNEEDASRYYTEMVEKYVGLVVVNSWIEAIAIEQMSFDEDDDYECVEPISSKEI